LYRDEPRESLISCPPPSSFFRASCSFRSSRRPPHPNNSALYCLRTSFTTALVTGICLINKNPYKHHINTTAKMAYQNSSPQIVTGTQPITGKAPISKWWPIGVLCSSVFFFVLGGGLLGAWSTSFTCSEYDYSCDGNVSDWNGGIACIAIGAILKFVFWVLLIIWCVQRRRARAPSTIVYINTQANVEAGTVQKPQTLATVYSAPQQDYTVQPAPEYGVAAAHAEAPPVEKQLVTRYCGHCGTGTTTPYCPRCGSQVPM
jgi:hypothetical protein